MDPNKEPGVEIKQIFIETVEFGLRADHLQVPPDAVIERLETEMGMEVMQSEDGKTGAVRLTVRTVEDDQALYRFKVCLVAVVAVKEGAENATIEEYAAMSAGPTLYPFAREVIGTLTARSRFNGIWMDPLNFRLLVPGGAPQGARPVFSNRGDVVGELPPR